MTLRSWIYLFWTTLVIGTIAGFLTGFLLISIYQDFSIIEVQEPGFNLSTIAFILISGALFGMISLTGFFSYLIVRYIAVGIFRKKWMWDIVQVCLIAIAFIDTVYLRYAASGQERNWLAFTSMPIFVMVVALGVSYWKAKLTQGSAFLPTLLFMYVGSIIEAIPGIRSDNDASALFMLIPLMICNAWQILRLHKLVANKKELPA